MKDGSLQNRKAQPRGPTSDPSKKFRVVTMKKQLCALAVGLALLGCSDDEAVNQALQDFGVIEGYIGNLHTNQKVAASDGDGHVFPGHANHWDLDPHGSLRDGGGDQFDGAFYLSVGAGDFPSDQRYDDVRFLSPEFGQAQGFVGVSTRNDRAVIAAGRNNQLLQLLDLRNATGAVTLNWSDETMVSANLAGEPLDYQVVIFDSSGNETVLFQTSVDTANTNRNADLTAFRGAQVVLGFRVRNTSNRGDVAAIDNVSVVDGAAAQFVTNGGFDGGSLNGWLDGSFPSSTNVRFSNRTVDGITVQRYFYADPNKLWGRQLDTFTNNGGSAATFTINYSNDLGSDGGGVYYLIPNTQNQALGSFDFAGLGNRDRDLGLVFGNAQNLNFTSDGEDGIPDGDGSGGVQWGYPGVTLQPGQTIVLVHFAILTGNDTGLSPGVTGTTQIPDVNEAAQRIVSGQEPDAFQVGIPLELQQLGFFNWQ